MKPLLALLLVCQVAAPAAPHGSSCVVQSFKPDDQHKAFNAYMCQYETAGEQGPVHKAWFTQHCKGDDWRATCDAYPPDGFTVYGQEDVTAKDAAKPPKHVLRDIAYGAIGIGVIVACAYGGGCGFMGGD